MGSEFTCDLKEITAPSHALLQLERGGRGSIEDSISDSTSVFTSNIDDMQSVSGYSVHSKAYSVSSRATSSGADDIFGMIYLYTLCSTIYACSSVFLCMY